MNQDLITALRLALFAGKQEGCLEPEQVELIQNHIELLSKGYVGVISSIVDLGREN